MFKKIKAFFMNYVDDMSLILGFTSVSVGVFKIYVPAGFIVLGICFMALAYFIAKRRW
ncbi:hypothetical protein HNQ80_004332 [Anaerosolibacter carboniphilus]|uniref:Uncharacterized protein n=1 Tax=Anaerosolibacter carboniphilus TaxID=1417629 RepID=A0A841L503_9FIRM|nr:hypothetical protein [Anaerosolibacter carboniphilus]MBB6218192.1 hypothetical protein [Anaerosolibacter carboniphilus]